MREVLPFTNSAVWVPYALTGNESAPTVADVVNSLVDVVSALMGELEAAYREITAIKYKTDEMDNGIGANIDDIYSIRLVLDEHDYKIADMEKGYVSHIGPRGIDGLPGIRGERGPQGQSWAESDPNFQEFLERLKDLEDAVFEPDGV